MICLESVTLVVDEQDRSEERKGRGVCAADATISVALSAC